MAIKRRNPIRSYLKKEKISLALAISNILKKHDDLSAREICTFLFKMTKSNANDKIASQHITNITKDFNDRLANRLEYYGIEKYFNENDNVFKYKYKTCHLD